MQLVRHAGDLKTEGRKVCLAIGVFDGVHLGHQQVIRQCILDARQQDGLAVAVTFDRHPMAVVAPERAPLLIYSLNQRLEVIGSLGVDAILVLDFSPELSRLPGRDFIENLRRDLGPLGSICVGATFTFGYKRSGTVTLLKELGSELGFSVHGLAALSLDGEVVSSTRIREAIRRGDIESATQMLGRSYSLRSTVIQGDHLGRKLGFATANLDVRGLLTPPTGVYVAHARVADRRLNAVVNIGTRPTLGTTDPVLRVEAHILDFAADIYGAKIELSFLQYLRPEKKFANVEELKAQISRDIEAARHCFHGSE